MSGTTDSVGDADDLSSLPAVAPRDLSPDGRVCHLKVARAMAADSHAARFTSSIEGTRALAYWRRDGGGDVDFLRPDHHTLSVYIEGGQGVHERGAPQTRGAPGAIFVLPAGHESRWFNDAHVGVLHVYFDDADLESLMRCPPPALRQSHFGDDPLLHALGRSLVDEVDWHIEAERLVVEQLVRSMLARLLARHPERPGESARSSPAVRGMRGLSSRRLADIEARLAAADEPPATLTELAAIAGLGVRQFARAYRAATGTTPGRRAMALRVTRAQSLIRQGMALVDVAAETGFVSQSHFTDRFRKHVGTTPAKWRASL